MMAKRELYEVLCSGMKNAAVDVVMMPSCTAGRGHQTSFTEHLSLHAQQGLKGGQQNDGENMSYGFLQVKYSRFRQNFNRLVDKQKARKQVA
jgi:hypothetical protein